MRRGQRSKGKGARIKQKGSFCALPAPIIDVDHMIIINSSGTKCLFGWHLRALRVDLELGPGSKGCDINLSYSFAMQDCKTRLFFIRADYLV